MKAYLISVGGLDLEVSATYEPKDCPEGFTSVYLYDVNHAGDDLMDALSEKFLSKVKDAVIDAEENGRSESRQAAKDYATDQAIDEAKGGY